MLEVGTKAPKVELPDQNGVMHTLEERKVIEAYDVWKEKKNYGKVSMGVVRTTYLIDEEGIIIRANNKVKVADDPEKMLGEV
jgi:peroxiredoxin Q/BCP